MIQVDQHGHGLAYNLVRLLALDIDYKANTTGILFELRVIQALLGWQPRRQCVRLATSLVGFAVQS